MNVSPFQEAQIPKRNYRKVDYDALNGLFLTVDWNELFSGCLTPTDMYTSFLDVINFGIENFVPFFRNKTKYPKTISKILSKKKLLWRKYKLIKDLSDLMKFKQCNALFKKEALKLRINEEQELFKSKDMSKFFKFVNARLKNAKTASFLKNDDGTILHDDFEKANLFNEYFASVFTTDDGILPNLYARTDDELDNVEFSEETVFKAVKAMKSSFSIDPDGLCSFFLKKVSFSLCKPLSRVFEFSFNFGKVPEQWKKAVVVPLHKKVT